MKTTDDELMASRVIDNRMPELLCPGEEKCQLIFQETEEKIAESTNRKCLGACQTLIDYQNNCSVGVEKNLHQSPVVYKNFSDSTDVRVAIYIYIYM